MSVCTRRQEATLRGQQASLTTPAPEKMNAFPESSGYTPINTPRLPRAEQRAQAPLHGPGTQKATGRGKKRAGAWTAPDKAKRKRSKISDEMPVVKIVDRDYVGEVTEANDEVTQERHTITPAEGKAFLDKTSANLSAPSVAAYTPPTSMDQLSTASVSTSVDVLRSSAGNSTVVYSSQSIPGRTIVVDSSRRSRLGWSTLTTTSSSNRHAPQETASKKALMVSSLPTSSQVKSLPNVQTVSIPEVRQVQSQYALRDNSKAQETHLSVENVLDSDDADALSGILELVNRAERGVDDEGNVKTSECKAVPITPVAAQRRAEILLTPDEEFLDLMSVEVSSFADREEGLEIERSPAPQARNRKLNLREVDPNEDYGGALLSLEDQKLLAQLKVTRSRGVQPVVRKPFPVSLPDRSPIFGAANSMMLRTCFRLGEALNAGTHALHTNQDVILEIYARVESSQREVKSKYCFVFRDLYHDNPPYLHGTLEPWHQSRLSHEDSRPLLSSEAGGKLCRTIANMKRDPAGMKCLEILSISEATWEDVDYAAAIYAKDLPYPRSKG